MSHGFNNCKIGGRQIVPLNTTTSFSLKNTIGGFISGGFGGGRSSAVVNDVSEDGSGGGVGDCGRAGGGENNVCDGDFKSGGLGGGGGTWSSNSGEALKLPSVGFSDNIAGGDEAKAISISDSNFRSGDSRGGCAE
jgi:hypothetical protein